MTATQALEAGDVRTRRTGTRRLRRSPAAVVGLGITTLAAAVAFFNERIARGNPLTTSPGRALEPPSWDHVMGADQLGRDIFTGVVRGAHTSLSLVAAVVVIAGVIGVLVGTMTGLRGGVFDDVVVRLIETVQTVPRFFLAILAVAWFGPGHATLTVLLGLTSWPFLARVVRARTLSLRENEFVDAARCTGASNLRIVSRHLVPNILPDVLVVLALTASRVVLLEASLAFLGLGDPNVMSWGTLINNAQAYLQTAWWMSVFPGLALSVTVVGINLLADGLTQVLDPAFVGPATVGRSPQT